MQRLQLTVEQSTFSVSWAVICTILMTPILVPYYVLHVRRAKQRNIARVLSDFNKLVMEPVGLFATTQRGTMYTRDGETSVSWLAVSITQEDVIALRAEGHMLEYDVSTARFTASEAVTECFVDGTPRVM